MPDLKAPLHRRCPVLGRRDFLSGALAFAGVAQAAASGGAPRAARRVETRRGGLVVRTYHDARTATHAQYLAELMKQGLRMRSLSIYRGPNVMYAAVWTNARGGETRAFHGLSESQFQAMFDSLTPKGFRPTILTATGGGDVGGAKNEAVLAGVFEREGTPHVTRIGLDSKGFKESCGWAMKNGFVLRCATMYGGRSRQYAGIWEQASGVSWDYRIRTAVDGEELGLPVTMPGSAALRLSFVTRSPFAEYLAVYRSDQPADRLERHGLTSAQYQQQHDALAAQGYTATCVQAGGDPRVGEPRFVAIFEKQ